jgi:ribokinase
MIVVFGSINIDLTFRLPHLPAVGETVLTPTFTQAVGGKGANQAIAAARDGAPTRFIGCVGSDTYGQTARAAMADVGIDISGLRSAPEGTAVAAVWIDGEGRNQIAVASGANRALKADALVQQAMPAGTIVVLQMETPASEVGGVIAHARERNCKIILNLAPALPLARATLKQVDVLVVNEHEAATLSAVLELGHGEVADLVVAIARVLGNTVVITLGAKGAIGARDEAIWRVEALPVTIVGAMPSFPAQNKIDAALLASERMSGRSNVR